MGWSNNRVTLPMKTLNLRIVSRSGGSITVGTALIRFLIAYLQFNWHLVNNAFSEMMVCVHKT